MLFLAVVLSAARGYRRGRAARRAGDDLADHHRVRWETPPERFAAAPEHWPRAAGAIFTICQGLPWDSARPQDPRGTAAAGLAEAWGIRSRPQLLAMLHWLLTSGHRSEFIGEQVVWGGLTPDEAAEVERQLTEDARTREAGAEALWRFRRLRANDRHIQSVDFTAWDLVRFIMLTRAGQSLGYLSEAEAIDFSWIPAHQLQATYVSWSALGEDFRRARWYWNSAGGSEESEADAHDASRHAALADPQTGPWGHVPWSMALPEPRFTLVDALLGEGLIGPLTPEQRADAAPWERLLDDVVHERQGTEPSPG